MSKFNEGKSPSRLPGKTHKSLKSLDNAEGQPRAPFDFHRNFQKLQLKKKTAVKQFLDKTSQNPAQVQHLITEMKRQGLDNESVYL
jgi:hypothetical protein